MVPLRSHDTASFRCLPGFGLVWNLIVCFSQSDCTLRENAAKAPEDSVQSKTGNISLVQQRISIDGQHTLQKRLSYTENFQNHRLKARVSSKDWKCITVESKIIEKTLFPLKESLKYVKLENSEKKKSTSWTSKKTATFNLWIKINIKGWKRVWYGILPMLNIKMKVSSGHNLHLKSLWI